MQLNFNGTILLKAKHVVTVSKPKSGKTLYHAVQVKNEPIIPTTINIAEAVNLTLLVLKFLSIK